MQTGAPLERASHVFVELPDEPVALQMCVMRPMPEELCPSLPFLVPPPAAPSDGGMGLAALSRDVLVKAADGSAPGIVPPPTLSNADEDEALLHATEQEAAHGTAGRPFACNLPSQLANLAGEEQRPSHDVNGSSPSTSAPLPNAPSEALLALLRDDNLLELPVDAFDSQVLRPLRNAPQCGERAAAQAALMHVVACQPHDAARSGSTEKSPGVDSQTHAMTRRTED